jgi:hypothetical protein
MLWHAMPCCAMLWEALGLRAPCNTSDNGVHASASPFEGLAEKMNWLVTHSMAWHSIHSTACCCCYAAGAARPVVLARPSLLLTVPPLCAQSRDLAADAFGVQLLGAGVGAETIKAWAVDPQVAPRHRPGSFSPSLTQPPSLPPLGSIPRHRAGQPECVSFPGRTRRGCYATRRRWRCPRAGAARSSTPSRTWTAPSASPGRRPSPARSRTDGPQVLGAGCPLRVPGRR